MLPPTAVTRVTNRGALSAAGTALLARTRSATASPVPAPLPAWATRARHRPAAPPLMTTGTEEEADAGTDTEADGADTETEGLVDAVTPGPEPGEVAPGWRPPDVPEAG